ncbi:MAG: sigma-70 family RNA polymerase sigma factor [Clostridiales bacterium]|nr:sigma-70 family RNA polymerase sigma factor [Clostridiales bacterium]
MDDSRIIDLFFARDERAIEETNNKYGAYCFTVANNILESREDAEECVSDTWLRAWNAIPPKRPAVLKAFLLKIARNISLDRLKAARAAKRGGGETELAIEELGECVAGTADVFGELMEKRISGLIRDFVHGLTERERAVFVRRYFFLESVKTVAQRYGMSEGSVMTQLSRTRKKLKDILEKELN